VKNEAELNYRRLQHRPKLTTSPLDHLRHGEVGHDLSFSEMVPNPFDLSTWEVVIESMEQRLESINRDSETETQNCTATPRFTNSTIKNFLYRFLHPFVFSARSSCQLLSTSTVNRLGSVDAKLNQ